MKIVWILNANIVAKSDLFINQDFKPSSGPFEKMTGQFCPRNAKGELECTLGNFWKGSSLL